MSTGHYSLPPSSTLSTHTITTAHQAAMIFDFSARHEPKLKDHGQRASALCGSFAGTKLYCMVKQEQGIRNLLYARKNKM